MSVTPKGDVCMHTAQPAFKCTLMLFVTIYIYIYIYIYIIYTHTVNFIILLSQRNQKVSVIYNGIKWSNREGAVHSRIVLLCTGITE